MKTLVTIFLSFFLALTIVLGYTGITVFKMVCASENGKVVLSMLDNSDECSHNKPQEKDCCKPPVQKQDQPGKSCCDYSHLYQKLDDDSRIEQQLNSTNHYLHVFVMNTSFRVMNTNMVPVLRSGQQNPPPLLSLRKQPFQSFTQSYLI